MTGVQLQLTAQAPANGIFNGSPSTNTPGNIDIRWLARDLTSSDEGSGKANATVTTSGITYNNYTTYTGVSDEALGTYNFNGTTSGLFTASSLALTSGFLSDILGGSKTDFELLPSSGSQVSAVFTARDYTGSGASSPLTRPALSITAIAAPEPARVMLFLFGSLALLLHRRRAAFLPCHLC